MEENRYSHDAMGKNEPEQGQKTSNWTKVGFFFSALLMALVTVFIMNL